MEMTGEDLQMESRIAEADILSREIQRLIVQVQQLDLTSLYVQLSQLLILLVVALYAVPWFSVSSVASLSGIVTSSAVLLFAGFAMIRLLNRIRARHLQLADVRNDLKGKVSQAEKMAFSFVGLDKLRLEEMQLKRAKREFVFLHMSLKDAQDVLSKSKSDGLFG